MSVVERPYGRSTIGTMKTELRYNFTIVTIEHMMRMTVGEPEILPNPALRIFSHYWSTNDAASALPIMAIIAAATK